ncbi:MULTISPECIES: TlpA family protein disulfide reductase [Paenibacillus]|uniref:TlpA family protein disulfide reductase n=1 Tax=Paenibacillus TaxID=44249 RepID=UPI00211AB655|nr:MULTISPECIES: TlpA disulfide reductase family protein [Paenibacillus]
MHPKPTTAKVKITGLLVSFLGAVLLLSACTPSSSAARNAGDDRSLSAKESDAASVAPDFNLKNLEGEAVQLHDFKGEKVYIKYWASWCSICLAGLDELNQLAGEDPDFRVISIVSPDFKGEKSAEDFSKWYKSMDEKNLTVLLDPDGTYAQQFGVRAYPTSLYIDTKGKLAKTVLGHNSNDLIRETVAQIQ